MFAMPKTGGAAQGRVNSYEIAFGPAAGHEDADARQLRQSGDDEVMSLPLDQLSH